MSLARCPTSLVGLPAARIQTELGQARWSAGCRDSETQCTRLYSFYYLPSSWIGGGQEAELRIDEDQRVAAVRCYFTQ
ncbi:MAG: hypothetical protein EOO73_12860 [Myxococcales bacterium]|nr:MAG: hypothetical protein EOO73_12860 [Myxococcales bacterium]